MNVFRFRAARRACLSSLVSTSALAMLAATAVAAAPDDARADAARSEKSDTATRAERPAAPEEKKDPPAVIVGPDADGVPGKRPELGYWSAGEPRWFVSTKSDIGTPYLKPYFSAGYGMPHFIWAGVDVNSITTLEFTQLYGGIRAATPILDFAFGYRDTWSFGKPFLAPQGTFTRSEVLDAPGAKARYWAWEFEVVGIVPLPHAAIVGDFILVKTLDVPDGRYVYEESYRAIVAKPLYAVMRTAVVARLLREDALKVGALLEHVFETGRARPVWRLGPAFAIQITDHLEAQGALTLAFASPDSLGLVLGAYGVAGLRYRWATGEPAPKLPWQGEIIP